MKKTLIQAFIFSLIIHILIIGSQFMIGSSLVLAFVPKPESAYDNVKYISQEVSTGSLIRGNIEIELLVTFIAGMAIFIIGKSVIIRIRKKTPR